MYFREYSLGCGAHPVLLTLRVRSHVPHAEREEYGLRPGEARPRYDSYFLAGPYTNGVWPGMEMGYEPSLFGRIGGAAWKVYSFGESSSFDAIASSQVIALPV